MKDEKSSSKLADVFGEKNTSTPQNIAAPSPLPACPGLSAASSVVDLSPSV
jgi:hypothetical protein